MKEMIMRCDVCGARIVSSTQATFEDGIGNLIGLMANGLHNELLAAVKFRRPGECEAADLCITCFAEGCRAVAQAVLAERKGGGSKEESPW